MKGVPAWLRAADVGSPRAGKGDERNVETPPGGQRRCAIILKADHSSKRSAHWYVRFGGENEVATFLNDVELMAV